MLTVHQHTWLIWSNHVSQQLSWRMKLKDNWESKVQQLSFLQSLFNNGQDIQLTLMQRPVHTLLQRQVLWRNAQNQCHCIIIIGSCALRRNYCRYVWTGLNTTCRLFQLFYGMSLRPKGSITVIRRITTLISSGLTFHVWKNQLVFTTRTTITTTKTTWCCSLFWRIRILW